MCIHECTVRSDIYKVYCKHGPCLCICWVCEFHHCMNQIHTVDALDRRLPVAAHAGGRWVEVISARDAVQTRRAKFVPDACALLAQPELITRARDTMAVMKLASVLKQCAQQLFPARTRRAFGVERAKVTITNDDKVVGSLDNPLEQYPHGALGPNVVGQLVARVDLGPVEAIEGGKCIASGTHSLEQIDVDGRLGGVLPHAVGGTAESEVARDWVQAHCQCLGLSAAAPNLARVVAKLKCGIYPGVA